MLSYAVPQLLKKYIFIFDTIQTIWKVTWIFFENDMHVVH